MTGVQPVGPVQLDEWERLAEKATPGPWVHRRYDEDELGDLYAPGHDQGMPIGGMFCEADAEFVAASRDAVATLVAEVRRLSAQVEAVRKIHVRGRLEPVHGKPERFVCDVCTDDETGSWQSWPCPTIASLSPASGEDRG